MSSLSTLLSKLRDYIKSDPNDKIWSTQAKTAALNSGYFQLQKDGNFNWPENESVATFNTIGGVQEYLLSTYIPSFIRLDLAQFTDTTGEIFGYTKEQALRNANSGTGRPSNYYIYGGNFGFYPTPDQAYPIRVAFRKKLPTLTDVVDSEFPVDYDDAIVLYAAYKLWATTKNGQKTGQALQDYKLVLDTLKNAFLFNDTSTLSFPYQRASGYSRRMAYDPKILNN